MTTTTADTDWSTEAEDAIRDYLSNGDSKRALNRALHTLQAQLAILRHARKGRPADGQHLDAHLAGTVLAIAVQVGQHASPDDFPGRPRGYDLLTVFQAAYETALAHPGEGE